MARKKVKLALIANDSTRRSTFKKRKKGLIKKVNEITTLCGINACAIIYSPYDTDPEVWPSNSGAQRVIEEFRAMPETDQHKKMMDQETLLQKRIDKETEHLRKQRKDNRELEMTEVLFHSLKGQMGMFNLNLMDLNDLAFLIDQYLKAINRRLEILHNSSMEAAAEGVGNLTVFEAGSSSSSPAATAFVNPIQQQIPSDSSTAPASVTDPNLINNI